MQTETKPFTEEERATIRRNAEIGAFIAASTPIPGYEATIAAKDAEIRRLSDELIAYQAGTRAPYWGGSRVDEVIKTLAASTNE